MTLRGRRREILFRPFAALLAIFLLALAPAAGAQTATKLLYPYDNGDLTRTPQPTTNTTGVVIANKGSKDYTLTPAITAAKPLVLSSGTITVTILASQGGGTITASLWNGTTQIGTTPVAQTPATTAAPLTFSIPLASNYTLTSGSLILRINNPTNGSNKNITVYQYYGAPSKVSFVTSTFINIDSLAAYSATYPSVATRASYAPTNSVFIRATVSDPFGAADVNAANLTITNPTPAVKLGPGQGMTEVVSARTATSKTFEYEYQVPSSPVAGTWTVSVTAKEGTEGTVTHTLGTSFVVAIPALTITKSHSGNFTAGTNGSYSMLVHNGGGTTITGRTTVVDTLSSAFTYVSGGGGVTGWSCSAAGQVVTCFNDTDIPTGTDLAALPLTVAVSGAAPGSVDNAASLSNPDIGAGSVLSNTDSTMIGHPDLSTSTMVVADLNGGDADPGDILRYTITLLESAGAVVNNASVVDNIPAGVTGFNVTSVPVGATNASTGSQLNITGINFGASGSATIVFEVTVGAGAVPGDTIDNTATITNPNGPGGSAPAPTMIVSQSQLAAAGNKVLYLYDNLALTRTPQPASTSTGVTVNAGTTQTWTLSPVIPAGESLVLSAGTIGVNLRVNTGFSAVTFQAQLLDGATVIGSSAVQNINTGTPTASSFAINLPSDYTMVGNTLTLRLTNSAGGSKNLTVYQYNGGASTISFATTTVVNVDSVATYAAAYPSTTTRPFHSTGDIMYVRAVVSDPFGSADVSAATLTLTDSNGVAQVAAAGMSEVVAAATAASKTFEYAYTVPAGAAIGVWTASVTGHEGTEGTVTHTYNIPVGLGVARLTLLKSHSGDFTAGTNGSYSLVVHNNGVLLSGSTTTVTDTLPAGLSYVSASGSGWTCGAVGQVVTCTTTASIAQDADLPALTLVVAVAGSTAASIDNNGAISNPSVDSGNPQNSNVDTATILHPDLSTSSMAVVDLNGGDADPGDILRYTITLLESAGAVVNDASVVDNIPAGVTGFNVTSVPVGATNASTGSQLNITGIDFGASGSATIVFEVTVGAGAVPGDTIDNTATITNPNGPGGSAPAPTTTVSQSQLAGAGNKVLYLYDNLALTRTPQPASTSTGVTVNAGTTQTWTLSPVIPAGESLVLSAGTIGVNLRVNTGFSAVTFQAQLLDGATVIGSSAVQNINTGTPTASSFAINLPSDYTMVGNTLTLRLTNSAGGNKNLTVYQYNGGASTISFATTTVVNVDSVAIYSGASPAVTTQGYYLHGDTVYVRAVVSDPFGSADVSAAEVTLTDSNGAVRLAATAMSEVVAAATAASKTFEYAYVLPADARLGSWTASVVAHEGTEGTVTHTGNAAFDVHGRITVSNVWAGAPAGTSVDLAIAGANDTVAGNSVAPSSVTAATATSAAAATITLSESYTTGLPGDYTITLACSKDSDASTVAVAGGGLSQTFTMPVDSSVSCTWTNSKTVPLTVVKLSVVHSDPVNGTTNPKAVPGSIIEYSIVLANPAVNPIDSDSVVISDPLTPEVELQVVDFGGAGSGPVSFTDGSPVSGMTYTFTSLASTTDDVAFSSDGGLTWTYVPTPDGNGSDAAVNGIRINPKGVFNANNAQFTVKFRVRIK